jgi:hypothetical protein
MEHKFEVLTVEFIMNNRCKAYNFIDFNKNETMERKFTAEQIEKLIQYLQGTCMSLDEGISEILGENFTSNDLTTDEFEHIDNEIFLCEDCGWWCELIEESEENPRTCIDCNE